MSHDPDLTATAARKLDQLLLQYPDAQVSGLLVRVDREYAVVVTKEGRFEWFKLNHLGGIRPPRDETVPDTTDPFGNNIIMRGHRYKR